MEKLFKTMISVLILIVGIIPFQMTYLFEFSEMGQIFHYLRYDEHSIFRPMFQAILGIESSLIGNILLNLFVGFGGMVAAVTVTPFAMLIHMVFHLCVNCLNSMW